MKLCLTLILCLSAVCAGMAHASDDSLTSPVEVKLKFDQTSFRAGRPVTGQVILKNNYPATIPVSYSIELLHEWNPYTEVTTNIAKLPYGTTKFSLREFGFPEFNTSKAAVGRWQIKISQINVDDSHEAETELLITP